ncbi:MAG TPA: VWA domain-containing protein [Candidatus Sulfotelmatobacter sp.]|jgi:hypothetical protein|nr:VWA domain-containing protein [Candidatus Sulfotelmatobacter sp.]
MANNTTKKQLGSRPPPSQRPSTSSLSIFFIMGLLVVAAFIASGNLVPVDPNGPGGPPTLEPYYNSADYPVQHIITPTGTQVGTQKNLQLKTFNVDNCGQNSVLLFVIDTSGSMAFAGKMPNTKNALHYFVNNIGGKSVIGIDTFSKEAKTEQMFNYYNDTKQQVNHIIDGLKPEGWTVTKHAMQMAYDQLKQSITNEDYPGYAYNLILMTDGVPETPNNGGNCEAKVPDPNLASGFRCFAREEDPRIPVNIPDEIKQLGVDIYTINVYSPSYPSDKLLFPTLEQFLKEVASPPLNTHYFVSVNASNLSTILHDINNNICYRDLNGVIKPTVAP